MERIHQQAKAPRQARGAGPGRWALLPALVLLLAHGGCSSDYAYLFVSVTDLWPEIASLRVTATINSTPARTPMEITQGLARFAVGLPAGAMGTVALDVDALSADRSAIGKGHAEITLSDDNPIELSLSIKRVVQCSPRSADHSDMGACRCQAEPACDPMGARPVCRAGAGCVQCLADGDCGGTAKCDLASNTCVTPCHDDAGCVMQAGTPRCDRSKGFCVQCLSFSMDCAGYLSDACVNSSCTCGGATACDRQRADGCTGGACRCSGQTACPAGRAGIDPQWCIGGVGCRQCRDVNDCKAGAANSCTANMCLCGMGPQCGKNANQCIGAAAAGACKCGNSPACSGMSDTCTGAGAAGACGCGAGPACDPMRADRCASGACKCGDNDPCQAASATPFCVASACVACRTDGDCAAGKYCNSGACATCDQNDHCGAVTCQVCTGSGEPTCVSKICTCMDGDCDPADTCRNNACAHSCMVASDCNASSQGKMCRPSAGNNGCGCKNNADCPAQNPVCDMTTNLCVCGGPGGPQCRAGQMCNSSGRRCQL